MTSEAFRPETEISETAPAEKEENAVSDHVYGDALYDELPDEDSDEIEDTDDLEAAAEDTETESVTKLVTETEFKP